MANSAPLSSALHGDPTRPQLGHSELDGADAYNPERGLQGYTDADVAPAGYRPILPHHLPPATPAGLHAPGYLGQYSPVASGSSVPPTTESPEETLSPTTDTAKRKAPESIPDTPLSNKKRKERREDVDGELQDNVGPNGGAKHWTDEEKSTFFKWMLTSDEHWDAFKTRMNTVFRDCSSQLFNGRKSFTALKSCFHRNLDVFKQIHAFQGFCANHLAHMQQTDPSAQQPSIEAMFETARIAGLNLINVNPKIIDRWYETGWYTLFKHRYRDDPKTGLPMPYYGPVESAHSGHHAGALSVQARANIDPRLIDRPGSQPEPYPAQHTPAGPHLPFSPPAQQAPATNAAPRPDSDPEQPQQQPQPQSFPYLRSERSLAYMRERPPSPLAGPSFSSAPLTLPTGSRDVVATLAQLTAVTESLRDVCTAMKGLLDQQSAESKARTELLLARGGGGEVAPDPTMQKLAFATELLKTGPDNDEVRRVAIECLTKYLM